MYVIDKSKKNYMHGILSVDGSSQKKAILKLPRFFIHSIFVMGVGSLRVVIISEDRGKMSKMKQV